MPGFSKTSTIVALVALAAASLKIQLIEAAEPEEAHEVRGLVRSAARIDVRTDLIAPVAKAAFEDGMRFSKGDTLIEFDCRRYRAELTSARATAHAANIELVNKRALRRHGAAGKSEVDLARAQAARAKADTKVHESRVAQCRIQAPFSGRVVELGTRAHEMPDPAKPVITILDDTRLRLELVVPSTWLVWLKPGARFAFRVDETGKTHNGRIGRLGAAVDPVSQTVKAYGELEGEPAGVLAGMSGIAVFSPGGS